MLNPLAEVEDWPISSIDLLQGYGMGSGTRRWMGCRMLLGSECDWKAVHEKDSPISVLENAVQKRKLVELHT